MGTRANRLRRHTQRRIRSRPLSDEERARFREVKYEGSPLHKREPGDFGLTPPASPRHDKTLCDEASITCKADAEHLFRLGVQKELVSEAQTPQGLPKEFWAVDDSGNVYEAINGGTDPDCYHGYPIRQSDPLHTQVRREWEKR